MFLLSLFSRIYNVYNNIGKSTGEEGQWGMRGRGVGQPIIFVTVCTTLKVRIRKFSDSLFLCLKDRK